MGEATAEELAGELASQRTRFADKLRGHGLSDDDIERRVAAFQRIQADEASWYGFTGLAHELAPGKHSGSECMTAAANLRPADAPEAGEDTPGTQAGPAARHCESAGTAAGPSSRERGAALCVSWLLFVFAVLAAKRLARQYRYEAGD